MPEKKTTKKTDVPTGAGDGAAPDPQTAPATDPAPASTPKAHPTARDVGLTPGELGQIGVKSHVFYEDRPVVVGETDGRKIIESKQVRVSRDLSQPFLTEKEVARIGVMRWHRYKLDQSVFTTVLHGRRFMLTEGTFMALKDKGLVIQDG